MDWRLGTVGWMGGGGGGGGTVLHTLPSCWFVPCHTCSHTCPTPALPAPHPPPPLPSALPSPLFTLPLPPCIVFLPHHHTLPYPNLPLPAACLRPCLWFTVSFLLTHSLCRQGGWAWRSMASPPLPPLLPFSVLACTVTTLFTHNLTAAFLSISSLCPQPATRHTCLHMWQPWQRSTFFCLHAHGTPSLLLCLYSVPSPVKTDRRQLPCRA